MVWKTGGEIIASRAPALVAEPRALETTTEYVPVLAEEMLLRLRMRPAEPEMPRPSIKLVPFFCQWYDKGAVPRTATLNVALAPGETVRFAGWAVICGAELMLSRKMVPLPPGPPMVVVP